MKCLLILDSSPDSIIRWPMVFSLIVLLLSYNFPEGELWRGSPFPLVICPTCPPSPQFFDNDRNGEPHTAHETVRRPHSPMSNETDFNRLGPDLPTIIRNKPEIVLDPKSGLVVLDGGGTATYTVKLSSKPTENVIVSIFMRKKGIVDLDDDGDPNTAFTGLIFTPSGAKAWDTPQDVIVTAAEDPDPDSDDDKIYLTHLTVSDDLDFLTLTKEFEVTIKEDKDRIVLDQESLSVTDQGAAVTYHVKLASEPTSDVTVAIKNEGVRTGLPFWGGGTCGIDAGWEKPPPLSPDGKRRTKFHDLTFTGGPQGNWNTPQKVTVKAGLDYNVTDESVRLSHTSKSEDLNFNDLTAHLPVTIKDGEKIIIDPPALSVREGTYSAYIVKLKSAPTKSLKVTIESQIVDTNPDKDGYQNSLTFDEFNWNQPQTVQVFGWDFRNNRDFFCGTLIHNVEGRRHSVLLGIYDADKFSLPPVLQMTEGTIARYKLKLYIRPKPTDPVKINITTSDNGKLKGDMDPDKSGDQSFLSLHPADTDILNLFTKWKEFEVILRAPEDDNMINDTVKVIHKITSHDKFFNDFTDTFSVIVKDNDGPAMVLTKTNAADAPAITTLDIEEGTSETYYVRLNTQPPQTVTAAIADRPSSILTLDDDGDDDTAFTGLTFTNSDWGPKRVTVTALDDPDASDETVTLDHTSTSTDQSFNGLSANLTVHVTDEDVAGMVLTKTSAADAPAITSLDMPEGTSDTYYVRLKAEPAQDVTVAIADRPSSILTLDDDGDANTAFTGLTFTNSDWGPKQVTVTALDDPDASDETVTLSHTSTSTDQSFNGLRADLTVHVTDEDVVEMVLTKTSAADAPAITTLDMEEGTSETYYVRLKAQPAQDVTVAIADRPSSILTLDDDGDANTAFTGLTFTNSDWGPKPVMVTASDDPDASDETVTLDHTSTSTDQSFNGLSANLTVHVTDEDVAGMVLTKTSAADAPAITSLDMPEGTSDTYYVRLNTQPPQTVTVAIADRPSSILTLDDDGDANTAFTGLTFTNSDWGPKRVTVTALDDSDASDETVTLAHISTSTEQDFNNLIADLTVNVRDEDVAEVRFASSFSSASENVGIHHVGVSIRPAPAADFTLKYALGGTATSTADYTAPTRVTVRSGDSSVNIPITIKDDDVDEKNKTVTLTLTRGTGYNVISPIIHTLTIVDDDDITPPTPVTVTLWASSKSVEEGGSVELTVRLSATLPDEATIYLVDTPDKPPTEPGDYIPLNQIIIPGGSESESGTIYIKDDGVSEGVERFTVTIDRNQLPSGVKLGSPSRVDITILDDDPPPPVEVSLSAAPNPVDEGESITVTATLTGVLEEDVAVPLVYNYDETNQSPENGDYIPLSNITIFRGETEGSGEIQTIRDTDAEDEIFIVALGDLPPDLLQLGKETSQTVTIRDITSSEVIVNLSSAPNPVDEGESVMVTATLSEAQDTDVTIPLTLVDGTAGPQDYQASAPVQITINAGETRGDYSISTVADKIAEVDESFTVALGLLPSGLTKGEQSLVKVTITDDDEAGINTPPSVSVVEGGTQTFQITLTSKPLSEVTVMMTLPTGSLLTYSPPHLTFSPADWNMAKSVTLTAGEDDTDFSPNFETLTVTANGGGYFGVSEKISVTITDNDAPGIDVRDRVTVPEGGSEELKIALARSPSGPVVVTITRNTNPDLMLDRFSLTFTTADWQTPKTVTLTATEDDDFETDSGILLLTASGGGYDELSPITITVTIDENDAAGLVVEEAVTMKEGGTHPLEVRLLAQPSGSVTVDFSGHLGTDLSLSDTPLTFTPSNWNQAQTVTLTAAEDEDYETDTIELNLAASGGGYNGEEAPVTVTITDNDERPGPLTITIYDKRELEDAGAIQLPIELSRPTDAVVTVQYASTDGTAESGLDYTASRGIVIFDPGATRGVIEIEITDDELPESTETFAVTLLKPRNAIIARGTGTGTILDNDGGTAILRVEDALVQEEEGMVRFQVSLSHPQRQMISAAYRTQDGTAKAGEDYEASSGVVTLAPGTLDAMIAVPLLKDGLDWQEETFTVHLESSENAEIAKAVGVATIQAATTVSQEALEAYTARFVRTSATQVVEALGDRFRGADGTACGAATRAEMSRLWYSASSWDPSLGELLGGCRMSATSYSGSFSVWGRGAFRQFNGREDDGLTLDGEVTTGMLGADYRWKGGWLAGVLLSHSQGEGSFAAAQESGEITAELTGVYPYVSVARAGWEVWLSAGAGRGQAEVLELDGDLTSRFGAMGVRGTLVSNSTIGLNYHGDVLVTDAEIEEHAVTAEVYRVRAGVEANARINNVLRPYVEANVRSDGGSAETGVGLEFGGGMRIAYPAWRLRGDVHAQGLVMHTAAGFSEWGISGFVQVGNRSEGLMMRVRPSWGLGQGMSLYGQQTIRDAAPMGANAHRTELELGYGIPWKEGIARSIMGVTQLSQGRMYRLGGELRPWENLTFSIFGLAHGRTASLGDIGVNVRGSLRH